MPKTSHLLAAASLALATLAGTTGCTDDPAGTTSAGDGQTEQVAVDSSTTIIDVRTPAEFAEGHLEGAINIDLGDPGFASRIAALDPAGSYVVYCHSGNRSAQAATAMADLGFTDVADAGGIDTAAATTGLPVVR